MNTTTRTITLTFPTKEYSTVKRISAGMGWIISEAANVITPELMASIEEGRQQIRNGECTVCRTKEELDGFFDAL